MDMIFGEGPILSGNWYNPKTGDSFTVRDTYFEDNNLFVMTTDGRRMDYNLMSQYIQSDKPIPKMEKPKPQKQPQIPQEVLSQVATTENDDFMLEDDIALINSTKPSQQPQNTQVTITTPQNIAQKPVLAADEDEMLINRMLKRTSDPKVVCKISWSDFPTKRIDMLDMMAVDFEKIADYYINKIDLESLRNVVRNDIIKFIESTLSSKSDEENSSPKVSVPKTTTKENKKKTTKTK